jgi:hypothetical protein
MLKPLLALLALLLPCAHAAQPEGHQPARPPRLVLAFYYPWYGAPTGPGGRAHAAKYIHWEGVDIDHHDIASSTHYPALGPYDSHDPKLLAHHAEEAKFAGIDAFIISWWGKGSFEDEAVTPILDACAAHARKACIYYEQVAKPGTPDSIAAEFADLAKRYAAHPAYLTLERDAVARPVFFIYGRALDQIGPKNWKAVADAIAAKVSPSPILIADNFGKQSLDTFDGAHSYAPMGDLLLQAQKKGESAQQWARRVMPWWATHPRTRSRISTITVFPGYDDTKIRKPGMKVERDDGKLYETLWQEAIAADPDWILITSFNEWHEGSEIEPSIELGDKYLKLTANWATTFKSPDEKEKKSTLPPALPALAK